MTNPCQCGCGAEANSGKKFVTGHNKGNRKPRVSFTCQHCGKVVEVMPSLANRKFCSTNCRDTFRKERASEDHPQYKRVEHVCGTCGKTFLIAPRRLAGGKRYCSSVCGQKAKSARLKTLEPNYKGALSNGTLKDFVLERDGRKCKVCGFSSVIEVHHVTPRSKGGKHRQENLITLCPNHHEMAHRNMIDLKDFM